MVFSSRDGYFALAYECNSASKNTLSQLCCSKKHRTSILNLKDEVSIATTGAVDRT
ncbi:hypothetical protein ABKV19_016294 [Rosa sericea]